MNFLQNLSTREKVLLIVLFILIITYGSYSFIIQPFLFERGSLMERKLLLEERLRYFTTMEKGLADLKREHGVASQNLELLKANFIDVNETPLVLRMLRELVMKEGLEIVTLNPRAVQRQDRYSIIPIDLSIMGSYEDMIFFLDNLNKNQFIFDITSFTIRYEGVYKEEHAKPFIVLRMDLNFRFYLTGEEVV